MIQQVLKHANFNLTVCKIAGIGESCSSAKRCQAGAHEVKHLPNIGKDGYCNEGRGACRGAQQDGGRVSTVSVEQRKWRKWMENCVFVDITLIYHPVCYCRLLHDAINSTQLHTGTHNNILNAIEKADMAANESREAADRALKVCQETWIFRNACQKF